MSLQCLLTACSADLHSPQFLNLARHADHARAFTRQRTLPLPELVAVMLSGMRKRFQAELDEFLGHLEHAVLVRHVSERAFFSARAKRSSPAIPASNDWLIAQAEVVGMVPR